MQLNLGYYSMNFFIEKNIFDVEDSIKGKHTVNYLIPKIEII